MGFFSRDRAPTVDHAARGFTAAATIIDLTDESEQRRVKKGPQGWQEDAWRWYDTLGEISDGASWVSNGISRVRLVPALVSNPGEPPTVLREDELPDDVSPADFAVLQSQLQRLRGDDGGHSELNRLGSLNLWIAGDCNLLGEIDDDGNEVFDVLSVDELVPIEPRQIKDGPHKGEQSSKYGRRTTPALNSSGNPDDIKPISADAFVCRIWRRHPRYSAWPNSGMRAANSMCEAIWKFQAEINAVSESRVPMGILAFPNSMDFPSDPTDESGDGQATNTSGLVNDLMHQLTTPIKEPSSAARIVPYIMTGEGEDIEKIRYIDLSKTADSSVEQRIDSALNRLATSLDLPTEILTGKGNLNHWTAATIDIEGFKFHLEPLAIVWVMGLTQGYYRPALKTMGIENAERYCIWYDPTDLVSQPDDIETVLKLNEASVSLISDQAIRRRGNIPEDDAPDEEEIGRRIAMKQAEHARTTIQETPTQLIEDAGGTPPPGADTAPPQGNPATVAPPTQGPPQAQPVAPKMALTASAHTQHIGARLGRIEQSVFLRVRQAANDATKRALERAGARLRSAAGKNGLATTVKGANAIDIAGLLGKGIVEGQLATSATDLLDGSYESLRPDWEKWTLAAQLAAIKAMGLDPADYEDDPRLAEARNAGWDALIAGLMLAAAALLYHPNQEAPARGEFDDTTLIGAKAIRDALEAAGGGANADGKGSLLFGAAMIDVLNIANLSPQGYVWVYGEEYRQHGFDGHEQLEEVEFASWDDPVLAVNAEDDWVGEFYAPQDHDGCCCGFYRNVVAGEGEQADEEAA